MFFDNGFQLPVTLNGFMYPTLGLDAVYGGFAAVAYYFVVVYGRSRPIKVLFNATVEFAASRVVGGDVMMAENKHALLEKMRFCDLRFGSHRLDQ